MFCLVLHCVRLPQTVLEYHTYWSTPLCAAQRNTMYGTRSLKCSTDRWWRLQMLSQVHFVRLKACSHLTFARVAMVQGKPGKQGYNLYVHFSIQAKHREFAKKYLEYDFTQGIYLQHRENFWNFKLNPILRLWWNVATYNLLMFWSKIGGTSKKWNRIFATDSIAFVIAVQKII